MADKPTGRYVVKYEGKPLAARRFHLYRDCGLVQSAVNEGGTIMEPDDSLVALLELTPCQTCENRANTIAPEEIIGRYADAKVVIDALGQHGYVIRRERKAASPE